MRAGELRHLVDIQDNKPIQSSSGAPKENWEDFATNIWASVEDLAGREFLAAQQMNAEVTTRVKIRYMVGIKSSMRVVFGTRKLKLVSPPQDPDGRKKELLLMCKEME